MKTILHFTILAILLATSLFAQALDTNAPPVQPGQSVEPPAAPPIAKRLKINLFATTQFDSLINLLPNADSIRQNCQVVGMGIEDSTNHLVVVVFDDKGIPQALTFTPAELNKAASNRTQTVATGTKKLEQTGRTWFIIETTLKSAFTYTSSYGTIFDNGDDTKGQMIAGMSLLTIGGMLYGSYAFTKNMELGYGKVALMNYGSTAIGNYYPTFLSLFFANATKIDEKRWYSRDVYDSNTGMWNYTERPRITDYIRAGTSVIGFPLGIYLGSRLNIVDKDDYGKVALMEYFSQTFGALSFALPVFYYDDPLDKDNRHYLSASTGLAMCMIPAGFYGGYWLGRDKEISAGRGTLPWVTGAMGSLTGFGLASLGDEYHGIASARAILGLTIAGYAGGSWLGLNYHPQTDYTFWQSVFIGASAAAGTAVGVSFPLIANANNHRSYILFSIAGGWAGFYFGERLSLQLFEKSSRDNKASDIRVNLPGLAALPMLFSLPKTEGTFNTEKEVPAMPVANLEWKF
jgi:hypothetical protein